MGSLNAVLADCIRVYPWLQTTWTHEREYLECLSEDDIKQLVCVKFVDILKLFDKGLSNGSINRSDLPTYDRVDIIPLSSLIDLCFDNQGALYANDADRVFFIRSVFGLFKKAKLACKKDAVMASVHEFLEIDLSLREPTLNWGSCNLYGTEGTLSFLSTTSPSEMLYLDYVCGTLLQFEELNPFDIVGSHGPGSVSDLKRGMDKYLFPYWPDKLQAVFPYEHHVLHTGDLDPALLDRLRPRVSTEIPASLTDVPKTLRGPRLITVEQTAHQFIQGGLMRWMRSSMHRILHSCVDFTSQEPSKALALEASLTGDLATVDLSAASDRLSCWTVERAIKNSNLLSALNACRSKEISLDKYGLGTLTPRKFAGMGSAVTFPVQSLIYACCCIAAVMITDKTKLSYAGIKSCARKVRVFGDDLILPTSAVGNLVKILEFLELKVNMSKTHVGGLFRESCGIDAYNGYVVNPTYLGYLSPDFSNPVHVVSWIEVSNNAHLNGLWSLAGYLVSIIPNKVSRKLVVTDTSTGGISLRTFLTGSGTSCKLRYCKDTQQLFACTLGVRVKQLKRQRGSETDLLQYFLEAPDQKALDSLMSPAQFATGYLSQVRARLRSVWVPIFGLERSDRRNDRL